MNGGLDVVLERLTRARDLAQAEGQAITQRVQAEGRTQLTAQEAAEIASLTETRKALDERIVETRSELARSGADNPAVQRLMAATAMGNTAASTQDWARRTAQQIAGVGREQRAISTGTLDVPSLVLPSVTEIPWPTRLIDLFSNRVGSDSNAVEYYRESATDRDNQATVVADLASKPVSTFTVEPVTDRCRVIAHVSEPVPVRLLQDVPALQSWLASTMAQGVLAGLENQAIWGLGTGEEMTGLWATPGITTVSYSTDKVTSLRKGLTALQKLGEVPNGVCLNPDDAEAIDLTRSGNDGPFLTGGFEYDRGNGFGTSDQIFGPSNQIRRVVSPSVPSGWAILADWRQLKLFVREGMSIMLNFWSEDLFTKNAYIVRAEMRGLVAFTRPQAFAMISLHSGS
ncbi:phage major capsid family protein [Mycobacterium interjectum]|uniref:phage major capsid family protein n=1 Tax=Mycobacterium interjectum TaxID=33895 RepID=UPI000A01D87D|nr:phage major capsid protein [Mycobacterium interjectum]MCV7089616.1 phage major capsid protein [Mycobacterium interjectum]